MKKMQLKNVIQKYKFHFSIESYLNKILFSKLCPKDPKT